MELVNLSDNTVHSNTISRRRFLQGSIALSASGLLLGCSDSIELTQLSSNTPPHGEMHEWVFIGTDNTIIITNPQTEMGQGVNTSLPQIMAEELDADWENLVVRQAPLNSKFGAILGMQMTGGIFSRCYLLRQASYCWCHSTTYDITSNSTGAKH